MTLVLAFNSSDKLYLAADTRVTFKDGKHADNQMKIEPITQYIAVGCSGDGKMATYLADALKKQNYNKSIRELRNEIEQILIPLINKFINGGGMRVNMIFVGMNLSKRKIIPMLKCISFFKEHQGQSFPLKDVMSDGMNRATTGEVEIAAPDSHIFKIEIDTNPMNPKFEIIDYNWGECAVSGGGYTSNDIPREMMFGMEFNKNTNDVNNIILAIYKRFSEYIGGCVIVYAIDEKGIKFLPSKLDKGGPKNDNIETIFETVVDGGRICEKRDGVIIPFVSLVAGKQKN